MQTATYHAVAQLWRSSTRGAAKAPAAREVASKNLLVAIIWTWKQDGWKELYQWVAENRLGR